MAILFHLLFNLLNFFFLFTGFVTKGYNPSDPVIKTIMARI